MKSLWKNLNFLRRLSQVFSNTNFTKSYFSSHLPNWEPYGVGVSENMNSCPLKALSPLFQFTKYAGEFLLRRIASSLISGYVLYTS